MSNFGEDFKSAANLPCGAARKERYKSAMNKKESALYANSIRIANSKKRSLSKLADGSAKRPGKTTVVKSLVKPQTRVLRFPPLPVAAPLANTASTCGALIFGHGENMESSFLAKPPRRTCKWCVVRRPTSLRRISPFRCGQPGSLDGISFSLSPLIAIMEALQSLSENPWPWLPLPETSNDTGQMIQVEVHSSSVPFRLFKCVPKTCRWILPSLILCLG